jgi:hypothetical protein
MPTQPIDPHFAPTGAPAPTTPNPPIERGRPSPLSPFRGPPLPPNTPRVPAVNPADGWGKRSP